MTEEVHTHTISLAQHLNIDTTAAQLSVWLDETKSWSWVPLLMNLTFILFQLRYHIVRTVSSMWLHIFMWQMLPVKYWQLVMNCKGTAIQWHFRATVQVSQTCFLAEYACNYYSPKQRLAAGYRIPQQQVFLFKCQLINHQPQPILTQVTFYVSAGYIYTTVT